MTVGIQLPVWRGGEPESAGGWRSEMAAAHLTIIDREQKMGTRADFYIGRDPKTMEWLGSTAWDGYPGGIPESIMGANTVDEYRAAVAARLEKRDDGTTPDMGWPWPWEDSGTTDYAYAYDEDEGKPSAFPGVPASNVWASGYDCDWHLPSVLDAMSEDEQEAWHEASTKCVQFPDMTDVQNVTMGGRSGVMFLRVRE